MTGHPAATIAELAALFAADRAEERAVLAGTPEYVALRTRDAERRERVRACLAAGAIEDPEALYHAAWIMQHGDTPDDARLAFELSSRAAFARYAPARWLVAASYDRWCMYRGLPQRYGTQIVPDGERYRVWDVEPGVSDEERAALDVPPLAEMERRAAELTEREAQPPMEGAPAWLHEALRRWRADG